MIKRLAFLFFLLASSTFAQVGGQTSATLSNPYGGNLFASSTNCSVQQSCAWQKLPVTATATTVTLTGTFVATVIIETSGDGGNTFTQQSSQSAPTVVTFTTTSLTDVRVRCSAFTSGSIGANIQTAGNQLNVTINSSGGGVTPGAIPGTPGLNAIPVQSGLIAEYRILPGETAGTLIDYSGKGNNVTSCAGTCPTVNAGPGGIHGNGAGAANLPTAVNAFQTVQLFIGNTQGNTNGALLAGNGTSTSSVLFGLNVAANPSATQNPSDQSFVAGSRIFSGWMEGGNNFVFYPRAMVEGNIDVAWDMICDTAHVNIDTIYINAVDQGNINGTGASNTYISQRCSQGHQASGNLQLGGGSGGICTNWTYGCVFMNTGNIYYAVFYNRPLTGAEIAQNSAYLKNAMFARGVTPTIFQGTTGAFSPNTILAVDGDSLSCGSCAGATPNPVAPYSSYLTLNNSTGGIVNISNMARVGFRLDQNLNPYAPQAIDPIFQPNAPGNADVIWGGTNDGTGAATVSQLASYCQERHLIGWKCLVVTMISRTGNDAVKNAYNAAIRQLWPTFADALIDFAADPNLGADGANGSAVYFTNDHVHVQDVGIINDEAPWVQRAYNRLYGNHDFSTATVYSSAAAAAVATTAGSESTNTITLTMAATPANCNIGNFAQVAGTTPAGYSGNWLIRTRSATQITYFAATAGMGAITVQGTISCPQSQDADQYAVLNFGAGNHTLDSCQAYTGQYIYRKNINAAGSTIVPFQASETIDGAANLAIASNQVRILQSQLISAAAAGCTWRVIQ